MQSTGYFATIYRFGVLVCGPKNRVFDIKSGTIFVGIETLSRLSIFRSMPTTRSKENKMAEKNLVLSILAAFLGHTYRRLVLDLNV